MKPSIHKLQKYINLEAERGYDNRAVMGGLDRILERWQAEARMDGLPEDLIEAVAARIRDYPRLAESSRAEVLDGLMRRLQRDLDVPHSEIRIGASSTRRTPKTLAAGCTAKAKRRDAGG